MYGYQRMARIFRLDRRGVAYYEGVMKAAGTSVDPKVRAMADTALEAAENFQRMMQVERIRPYQVHKGYVLEAVRQTPFGTTGQVFTKYCTLVQLDDLETRTYRRVTQLLAELEKEGLVKGEKKNRGKRGRTKLWLEVV